jgi:hypothetical protein
MTCARAFEVDLAAFVRDARAAEWSAFREHYPRCADCAAEVRVWTELDQALATGSHPTPDRLARFAAAGLDAGAHREVTAHLASCPTCRDELTALRRFDFGALATAPAMSAPPASRRRSWMVRLLWHPAFAYAIALTLVLYPLLRGSPWVAPRSRVTLGLEREKDAKEQRMDRPAQAPSPPPPADRLMAKRAPEAAAVGALQDRKEEHGRSADADEPTAGGAAGNAVRSTTREAAKSVVAPLMLSLEVGSEPSIPLSDTAGGVRLRVAGAMPGGPVVVRDLDRDRRLEVRAAVAPEGRFDVAVPRGWLAEGRYRVDPPGLAFRVGR